MGAHIKVVVVAPEVHKRCHGDGGEFKVDANASVGALGPIVWLAENTDLVGVKLAHTREEGGVSDVERSGDFLEKRGGLHQVPECGWTTSEPFLDGIIKASLGYVRGSVPCGWLTRYRGTPYCSRGLSTGIATEDPRSSAQVIRRDLGRHPVQDPFLVGGTFCLTTRRNMRHPPPLPSWACKRPRLVDAWMF